MHTKPEASSELVKKFVVEGLQEIKGQNITVLDLREIENAVTDFFIIAEGNSNTQVNSLADSVHKVVRENVGDKPWHIEGRDNSEWVLMDYVTVVVHVFQKGIREFYDLEGLWGDAEITIIEND
ncbi:MAG: ribosome silencing factor [Schleiferiaceae bacterium]|jgi:ribosome-associated protein|nr:ribosome silencing factor [Schleiferiaceae bacterium]HBK19991.1 ribosome silencing factor [Cryomorphaceae bacterium]MDG1535044.1 ribosome silencing factor [Schleiferiaceae bacterium]MDG1903517.1 ribosome silencing factor [Schleiferiaceae bacterium]MDG1919046.1 ribosome silencing factor [Schleiferiaceae bacterium]|tara:strand:+ start:7619 stop:7990 length:372 start_codon:yes stop_codon:yes gene_type:complete